MNELQSTLNGDKSRFLAAISELRFWITQRRCQKTLQHLPVSVYEKLPLLFAADNPLSRLDKHKLFLRFHKHPNTLIAIEFKERSATRDVDFVCHLVTVKPVAISETPANEESSTELSKMYLKVNIISISSIQFQFHFQVIIDFNYFKMNSNC